MNLFKDEQWMFLMVMPDIQKNAHFISMSPVAELPMMAYEWSVGNGIIKYCHFEGFMVVIFSNQALDDNILELVRQIVDNYLSIVGRGHHNLKKVAQNANYHKL